MAANNTSKMQISASVASPSGANAQAPLARHSSAHAPVACATPPTQPASGAAATATPRSQQSGAASWSGLHRSIIESQERRFLQCIGNRGRPTPHMTATPPRQDSMPAASGTAAAATTAASSAPHDCIDLTAATQESSASRQLAVPDAPHRDRSPPTPPFSPRSPPAADDDSESAVTRTPSPLAPGEGEIAAVMLPPPSATAATLATAAAAAAEADCAPMDLDGSQVSTSSVILIAHRHDAIANAQQTQRLAPRQLSFTLTPPFSQPPILSADGDDSSPPAAAAAAAASSSSSAAAAASASSSQAAPHRCCNCTGTCELELRNPPCACLTARNPRPCDGSCRPAESDHCTNTRVFATSRLRLAPITPHKRSAPDTADCASSAQRKKTSPAKAKSPATASSSAASANPAAAAAASASGFSRVGSCVNLAGDGFGLTHSGRAATAAAPAFSASASAAAPASAAPAVDRSSDAELLTALLSTLGDPTNRCPKDGRYVHIDRELLELMRTTWATLNTRLEQAEAEAMRADANNGRLQRQVMPLKSEVVKLRIQLADSELRRQAQQSRTNSSQFGSAAEAAAHHHRVPAAHVADASHSSFVHSDRRHQVPGPTPAAAAAASTAPSHPRPAAVAMPPASMISSADPSHCIVVTGGWVLGLREESGPRSICETIKNALSRMFGDRGAIDCQPISATLLSSVFNGGTANWKVQLKDAATATVMHQAWLRLPNSARTVTTLDRVPGHGQGVEQRQAHGPHGSTAAAASASSRPLHPQWSRPSHHGLPVYQPEQWNSVAAAASPAQQHFLQAQPVPFAYDSAAAGYALPPPSPLYAPPMIGHAYGPPIQSAYGPVAFFPSPVPVPFGGPHSPYAAAAPQPHRRR